MGIVNIATTSDGEHAAGARLNRYRKRQLRLRKRLQAKKTSSARRLLKKRRRKEARFAADVNHQISKRIVAEAERTGRGIAVEQLTGIRDAGTASQAPTGHGAFVGVRPTRLVPGLQGQAAGVAFVEVDPAYTSQTCSACGWVDKRNRRSQAVFECGRCGFVGHADHNAAINIAARGVNAGAKSCAHTQRPPWQPARAAAASLTAARNRKGQATSPSPSRDGIMTTGPPLPAVWRRRRR